MYETSRCGDAIIAGEVLKTFGHIRRLLIYKGSDLYRATPAVTLGREGGSHLMDRPI